MSNRNIGVFQGHSSRLPYDECAYGDKLAESVGPLGYYLDTNRTFNCNGCMPTFGPVPSVGTGAYSVNNLVGNVAAPAQRLVDLESILSNRNVRTSKCRDAEINDIDVFAFKTQQPVYCNDFLNSSSTRLTEPPINYRSISLNRFYDIGTNPINVIYYDQAINSQLEARDNYFERIPKLQNYDASLPVYTEDKPRTCKYVCK